MIIHTKKGIAANHSNITSIFLLITLICLSLAGLAQQVGRNDKSHLKGVIHVKFKPQYAEALIKRASVKQVGISDVDRMSQAVGVTSVKRIFRNAGHFEKAHQEYGLHLWYEIRFDETKQVEMVAGQFRQLSQIERSEPVQEYYSIDPSASSNEDVNHDQNSNFTGPTNDPLFPTQWHFKNTGQIGGGTIGSDIDLEAAWAIQSGSNNVIVAVIDGGIDVSHPDLAGAIWINGDEIPNNGVDDDNNGYIDDINGYGFGDGTGSITADRHGTHVAGIVGAVTNNGIGTSGIAGGSGAANGARLMSLATFGEFSIRGFEDAMVYAADNGAIISQNSWRGGSTAILAAIDYFIERAGYDNTDANFSSNIQVGPMAGGIVIFAAGNSNSDSPSEGFPGSYEKVVAVAATDHDDIKSSFSNYGSWVDISAPGSAVYSTFPVASGSYGYLYGTSMACPHVSGVAALIVSQFGATGFTPERVRNRLLFTADNIDGMNPAYIGKLGMGRLNANAALQPADAIAPSRISDLSIQRRDYRSISLTWTAPGESGNEGRAAIYDIRYSTIPITNDNFASATGIASSPTPGDFGSVETLSVEHLRPGTTYYFAIQSYDLFGNQSEISNIVIGNTPEIPTIYSLPYIDDFETTAAGWSVENSDQKGWVRGKPAKYFIKSVASGQNAWVTSLTTNYSDRAEYYLYSPRFDFSSRSSDPVLAFSVSYLIESSYDLLFLEYSDDNGISWRELPLINSENGYNCLGCAAVAPERKGWNGQSIAWKRFRTSLTGFAGKADVQFRVGFLTDVAITEEGVAIDDFSVLPSQTAEISIVSVTGPAPSPRLTNRENVTAIVRSQKGNATVNSIKVTYDVSGPLEYSVTRTFSYLNLQPTNQTSLTHALDFSKPGNYTVNITIQTEGEFYTIDNTMRTTVTHFPLISTFPHFDNFESADQWTAVNNDDKGWVRGTPTNAPYAFSGNNAWVTNLAGTYSDNARYYLYSPVFDFTSLTADPVLSFMINYSIQSNSDIAFLEYYDGIRWLEVPLTNSQNGYNCLRCTYILPQANGWSGETGWSRFSTDLTGFRGKPYIQFRIGLFSNNLVNARGMLIDDFSVYQPTTGNDLSIAITAVPEDACYLTSSESISAEVTNHNRISTDDVRNVDVHLFINGNLKSTQPLPAIRPGQKEWVEFTNIDLSSLPSPLEIRVSLDRIDDNLTNNQGSEIIELAGPGVTGTTPNSRCDAGTVILQASASAGTLNWYETPTGGNSLGTGPSFTTPSISSTTTFYVDATNNGCTSVRTSVLATVNPSPDNGVTQIGRTLRSDATDVAYQWIDCNNGNIINGETGQNFMPVADGSYAVIVTQNTCSSTSSCFPITAADLNDSPTDISISEDQVSENVSVNSIVGILSSADPNAGNTFFYDLVAGAGDTDNTSFQIMGGDLHISVSPDFETRSRYNIRIRTTDQDGLSFEEAFTISINDINELPTEIELSSAVVNENVPANAVVGILSSLDPDANNTFSYSLVAGAGDIDNASFYISGSDLRVSVSPDYETRNRYNVRIRTTDQDGLSFEEPFTISINDINELPTKIELSNAVVNENVPANTVVGILSSLDPDANNTFSYSLVAGAGDIDNASFHISGSDLHVSVSPDYETKNRYNIRIRTTDQGGLSFEEMFAISINDINETAPDNAPMDIALSNTSVDENVVINTTVGVLSTTDPDAGDAFTYSLVPGTGDVDNASFNISGNDLRLSVSPDYETRNSYSLRVRTTDQGGLSYEKVFDIVINDVNETASNIPPTSSSKVISMMTNDIYTFSTNDFDFADPDAFASLNAIKIETLPSNGELKLADVNVVQGQEILSADISNLMYKPVANEPADNYAIIYFRVSDGLDYSLLPYSITINVTDVVLSIPDVFTLIHAYPVPFSNSLYLELPETSSESFVTSVTNQLGARVYTTTLQGGVTHTITLEDLPAGVYVLEIQRGQTKIVRRLMKL
jgi:subtilisin family serine protease